MIPVDEQTKCAAILDRVDSFALSENPSRIGLPGRIWEGLDEGEMHARSAVMTRVQRERRTRRV